MNSPRLAFLIALSVIPSPLAAQGFDCAGAQTPVERLICAAPAIGALDSALNSAVQARLATAPEERGELLADSRRWLAERDKTCAVTPGRLPPDRRRAAIACLAGVYRERLSVLMAGSAKHPANDRTDKAICHRFIDAYRSALAIRANDPADIHAPLNQSPFSFLANIPQSGVTRAPASNPVPETTPKALDQWGRDQTPPLRISAKVKRDILNLGSTSILTIDQAPQTNFYVASQVQGTAHCIYTAAFTIRNGVTERVAKPLWSGQPGDLCGVDQFFGSIDGRTVAVLDNESPYEPSLAARLTFKSWEKTNFGPSCSVSFDYDPAFVDMTTVSAQEPDQKCDNAVCAALKPQALALVKAVHRDPLSARLNAVQGLSSTHRKTFEAMEKLARDKTGDIPPTEAPANPASYLDQNPLLLPIQHEGVVYLASVGHYTIGWRVYPDWSVKLEKLDHGAMATIGTAPVAMRRGTLRSAIVE